MDILTFFFLGTKIDRHCVRHPKSNCYSFKAKSGMIIHVSSSQCLVKRKAPFIPFPAVQLGCQWRPHPLIRHQCFLRSGRVVWQVHQPPRPPLSPPRRDLAPLLSLKLTQHGERCSRTAEKQFTGNTGNPILSQRADTHSAIAVSSLSVFPSIWTENCAVKVKKATMERRRLIHIALIRYLNWKGVFTLKRKKYS